MPSFFYKYLFTFIFFTLQAFSSINSLPVTSRIVEDNPYDEFIKFLFDNNCKMPSEIALPFQNSSESSNFNYLSTPLQECQTVDALQKNDEAYLLCKEIFDVLQNITCEKYNLPTKIDSTNHLSENVCKDFSEMQYVFPKRKDYLSTRLKDDVICGLMCTQKKYASLCQTLLWSYDVLGKITSAVKLPGEENKISVGAVSQDKEVSASKIDLNENKSKANDEDPKIIVNDKESNRPVANVDDIHPEDQNSVDEINSNNAKDSNAPDQILQIKSDTQTSLTSSNSSTTISENETGSKITSSLKNSVTIKAAENKQNSENLNVNQKDSMKEKVETVNLGSVKEKVEAIKPGSIKEKVEPGIEPGILPDLNIKEGPHDNQENDVNVDELPKKDEETNESQPNPNANNLPTTSEKTNPPQQAKNAATDVLKSTKKSEGIVNNNGTSKSTTKSDGTTVAPDMKNELSNVDLQEENKNTVPKTQEGDKKEVEKPKLTDLSETTSPTNSPLLEPTAPQLLPGDDEPHQEDKEQDQYNDTEKEDDYPKPDYDNAFNPPTKNKESNVKGSIIVSSQMSNNYDVFNPRNNIGRVREDILIQPLPGQEDSHFFFYFLSIVLILMAGYLIFHNKQKIIALIVEGRHERRRRSHGVGYKKLETK